MGETRQILVPDIGDFKDVPIIEIQVKPGDRVTAESPLITLESDKASMEVPSPSAGVVKNIAVKLGDRVSQGVPILTLEVDGAGAPAEAAKPAVTAPQKRRLAAAFPSHVTSGGEFILTGDRHRSRLQNERDVCERQRRLPTDEDPHQSANDRDQSGHEQNITREEAAHPRPLLVVWE